MGPDDGKPIDDEMLWGDPLDGDDDDTGISFDLMPDICSGCGETYDECICDVLYPDDLT